MGGSTTTDWIAAGTSIIQAAAILLAGGWAYLKFVRGRTFAQRAELDIDGELLSIEDRRAIRAQITLCNTGSSRIPLRATVVYISAVNADDWNGTDKVTWTALRADPVFTEHTTIEAREKLSDQVLIPLPDGTGAEILAYRIELRIYDRRRHKGKGATRWSSEAVVPVGLRSIGRQETGKDPEEREVLDERKRP